MEPARALLYTVADVHATFSDKSDEVYLVSDVKNQPGVKAKTSTVPQATNAYSWSEELQLSIVEPINAVVGVEAYAKNTIFPDHKIGEFTLVVAKPGTTQKHSGTLLSKSGEQTGTVQFSMSSPALTTANTTQPGYVSTEGSKGVPGAASDSTSSKTDAARIKADAVAQQASAKSNATAGAAEGKTVATVDAAEQKLQKLKADLAHGHKSEAAHQSFAGSQGAYSRAVGVPAEAGTASDAPGSGAASTAPLDGAAGGPIGSSTGPVPTLESPAADVGVSGKLRGAAFNAADKAQQALEAAKTQFSGAPPPSQQQ